MSATTRMTKGEQTDLLKLVRARERLAKTMVAERKAELVADMDQQLARTYHFDEDDIWARAKELADEAVDEADRQIAARCQDLGIPKEFAPTIACRWFSRGENAVAERRTELRRAGLSRIEKIERSARTEIEKRSVQAQEDIVTHGLESPAARAFLEGMGTVEALMPALDVNILLVERRSVHDLAQKR
jgi:hypothetical protein